MSHAAVQEVQGGPQAFSGTTARLSDLRAKCLVRDRHRCIISRKFDKAEAAARYKAVQNDSRDDDGELLVSENASRFGFLEVAHIMPHALMKASAGDQQVVCLPSYRVRRAHMANTFV